MDQLIYVAHFIFWAMFPLARLLRRSRGEASPPPKTNSTLPTEASSTARFSRLIILPHMVGIGIMYYGIEERVIQDRVPRIVPFPFQAVLGMATVAVGAALVAWAVVVFRSWRFRAKLDAGHELVTSGPYRLVRHPIYLGMNLLALGSAIWVPTAWLATGLVLVVLGGDLRGRAEEKLLAAGFGSTYSSYLTKVKRFIPGIY